MNRSDNNYIDAQRPLSNHTPRVSVGLPVYNGQNYLRPALDSLLSQTYKDFELIISDNASTDDTQIICEKYAQIDSRIRYIRNQTNIGAAANYNRVFEHARGEYFKWAAHDDICAPGFLQESVDVLDSDKSVVLCHPTEVAIDEQGEIIPEYMNKYAELRYTDSSSVSRRFRDLACLNHGCFQVFGLIRASVLSATPKIANYIGSDRVLLAELALMGRFYKTKAPIYFRRHSEQYCALGSDSSRSGWFDPNNDRNKSTSTERRILAEVIRSINTSSLSLSDRLMCYLVLSDRIWRKRKRLLPALAVGK